MWKQKESGEIHPCLIVELKYNGKTCDSILKRESKPGHRVYLQKNDYQNSNDYGIAIISTSKAL